MTSILFAGCGALGSWIALQLSYETFDQVWLVDDGRVQSHNVANSAYNTRDVGAQKVVALSGKLYVKNNVRAQMINTTVNQSTALIADIIVDTFDNAEARNVTARFEQTIHAGISEAKSADIMWNRIYDPHQDTHPRGQNPVCTHHLGTPIILYTATMTAWSIHRYITTGEKISYHITPSGKLIQLEV